MDTALVSAMHVYSPIGMLNPTSTNLKAVTSFNKGNHIWLAKCVLIKPFNHNVITRCYRII